MSIEHYISLYGTLLFLVIGGVIYMKTGLSKMYSRQDIDREFQRKEQCNVILKDFNHRFSEVSNKFDEIGDKVKDITKIKETLARLETKVDMLLEGNGKRDK